ncbi:MAG: S26 family signal peptidase [Nanoarchaeota archaeon]|nr:S26 family signal peptidase [Nanoarchaeota archaeon]
MVVKYILSFLIGFFSCALLLTIFMIGSETEIPTITGFVVASVSAPSDTINERDIIILDDMVILKIPNSTLSSYASTGSMNPLFDEGANGIRIVPEFESDIDVGDIVSYRSNGKLIVHRVIEKGFDEEGLYFIVKGDNNSLSDGKIRFDEIEYLTVGVIW